MKKRLDKCVMEQRGFSRTYAAEVIEAGLVHVKGLPVTKAGSMVLPADVEVLAPDMPFAGRGGVKLDAALEAFGIDVTGLSCLDTGASSGGFTDCLLKRGAKRVIAVDVGHGQMVPFLRDDPRVVLHEGTDIRDFVLDEPVDFVVCDVSFISITKVLPDVKRLLKPGGGFVALIKPQFEAERKGQKADREAAVKKVLAALAQNGFDVKGIKSSPIRGRDGNVEELAYSVSRDLC